MSLLLAQKENRKEVGPGVSNSIEKTILMFERRSDLDAIRGIQNLSPSS